MHLRPDTLALTALLAFLTALGPLSTDMYLPSLPAIAAALGSDSAGAQMTLSAFLFGFAGGQIFYGPLSDRLGRKPVLLGGMALFITASLACAFAPDMTWLVAGRFFQALGASGPIVLGRAIVRDLYEGPRAGRELSRMGTVMGVVPALAPLLGGMLETAFGWRSSFFATAFFGVALGTIVILMLPETLRERSPHAVSLRSIFAGFKVLLQHPRYRFYVSLSALAYSGLFTFISGSSFVLQKVYGLSVMGFSMVFSFVVLGFVTGTLVAQRAVGRLGLDRTIGLGVMALAGGGAAMMLAVWFGPGSPLEIMLPMTLYTMGVGLVMPQSMAGAMTPFPERAGAASSLLGLIQMMMAALVGTLLGQMLDWGSALPLPALILVLGGSALLVHRMMTRLPPTSPAK
jgi:DHA1 family bicyclomycin/chloramphenicol resistance-like MFS transporter